MIRKILRELFNLPRYFYMFVVTYFPGVIGDYLRYRYWKKRLKLLGKNVKIDVGVEFKNPQQIQLDDDCWIDRNVLIIAGPPKSGRITFEKENVKFPLAKGEVYIGKMAHIAPNCVLSGIGGIYIGKNSGVASNSTIYSFSHHYRNLQDRSENLQYSFTPRARLNQQAMISAPVFIGDFCAIGLNSVILPGAIIRRGSWIASGSTFGDECKEQSVLYFDQEMRVKDISNLKIKE